MAGLTDAVWSQAVCFVLSGLRFRFWFLDEMMID